MFIVMKHVKQSGLNYIPLGTNSNEQAQLYYLMRSGFQISLKI